MGMFDWVRFRGRDDFQTKSFDCRLDYYDITPEGLLQRHPAEDDHHGWSKETTLAAEPFKCKYTGEVRIYTHGEDYYLEFENGRLTFVRKGV